MKNKQSSGSRYSRIEETNKIKKGSDIGISNKDGRIAKAEMNENDRINNKIKNKKDRCVECLKEPVCAKKKFKKIRIYIYLD